VRLAVAQKEIDVRHEARQEFPQDFYR